MRIIKQIHAAAYHLIADLITYSPLPNASLSHIDPFLLLNHHGYQVYPPDNRGLPFGPHPHRGMETVTFIVAGDIMHRDSQGFRSIIKAGGIQWMTAGSGLIHAETSSEEFMRSGGELEILQLWLNLPARLKMTKPNYIGLQKKDIPTSIVGEKVHLQLIAGVHEGLRGAIQPLTDLFLCTVELQPGAQWHTEVSAERNILLYTVRGSITINGQYVPQRQLVEFTHQGTHLHMSSQEPALLIFGHALPFNEPIVAQGPFVMNSPAEIRQAYADYQAGKFGVWQG
ncbi:MAG: pirin family protein [Cytophagales bacterium]|nr:pirin family protein [Bernardetiaceae bacterium]MDW8204734.1 pirin family protein [Cytophagales bacterium]